ncbi:hypothetical protein FK531_05685 [Rhodococcus spelaei]|uniref:Uncharacterized protein n=1 Tax=Rhodococcus spelaei TaxID=2546320 RepID=A0A541BPT9_9NOCA|nr:hypothetical protein [Rhodococcus spelaei]TQF74356.1 hypothetical protein FK531_05685 [Rhodococcus spelaei]
MDRAVTAPGAGSPRARERVVLAHRRGARVVRTRVEVQEHTEVGEAMIRALVRAQLGLALRVAAGVVALVCAVPLVMFAVPALPDAVAWVVLGVAVYPVLYAVGRLYIRLAERTEQEFVDLADD